MNVPCIKAIVEPLEDGSYYVWAEVVGTKMDGYWARVHLPHYAPETTMCTRAVESLKNKLLKDFKISGVEWDGEVRWGTREKDAG